MLPEVTFTQNLNREIVLNDKNLDSDLMLKCDSVDDDGDNEASDSVSSVDCLADLSNVAKKREPREWRRRPSQCTIKWKYPTAAEEEQPRFLKCL